LTILSFVVSTAFHFLGIPRTRFMSTTPTQTSVLGIESTLLGIGPIHYYSVIGLPQDLLFRLD